MASGVSARLSHISSSRRSRSATLSDRTFVRTVLMAVFSACRSEAASLISMRRTRIRQNHVTPQTLRPLQPNPPLGSDATGQSHQEFQHVSRFASAGSGRVRQTGLSRAAREASPFSNGDVAGRRRHESSPTSLASQSMRTGEEPSARAPDSCYHSGTLATRGATMDKEGSQLIRGLEGVVAAETQLCDLDGAHGRLAYRGYDIADLARRASFEEVAHLLWYGDLPTAAQLDRTTVALIAARDIPREVVEAFRLMPKGTDPMRALQGAVALLGMHDPDATDNSHEANLRKAVRVTSQMATAICSHHRVRSGQSPVPAAPDLGHAANFLYMLTGKRPSAVTAKAFDASLTLYAEHELNASTFTTRVIVSTQSDLHSAVAGGVGALKGPLHGGAGEAVMRTLMEIGEVANVDTFADRALAEKRRLMGFGHRVYKAGDPRAAILRGMAEEACRQSGQFKWYEMAVKLHARINAAKGLIPNVDFYSAPLFYSLGIPVDLFTPVIAAGRIAGWTAHIIEQCDDNRLIRPRGEYVGPKRRAFVPVDTRA